MCTKPDSKRDWGLRDWTAIGTLVLAIVGVITLALTFCEIRTTLKDKEINEWQQVIVFSIIDNSGSEGITFDDIREKYVTEATSYEKTDIPKNKIQPDQLKLVLMDLETKDLIGERFDNKFFKRITPFSLNDIAKQIKSDEKYNSIGNAIIDIIISNPNKYDADDLYILVENKLKTKTNSIERRQFDRVLNEMITDKVIVRVNNKFRSNI